MGGEGEGGCHLEAHVSKNCLVQKTSMLMNKRIVVEVVIFQRFLENLTGFDRIKFNIFCSIRADLEGTVFECVIP